jgi:hypothetical protein
LFIILFERATHIDDGELANETHHILPGTLIVGRTKELVDVRDRDVRRSCGHDVNLKDRVGRV